ncbi:PEP-CTERM sorting domain-containing protein [Crocosphaera sp. UHCC 0190]|uniref:PEP-CTERM sorting domain-containing protein n=1 Tax=Crocosphaera sp. UHCC 0190 TaxID=3110246 RepID=UPI002B21F22A|nr:PEP-CTERM sorting domain-containing protein [Crocosphaera sp. UHCC 0190]
MATIAGATCSFGLGLVNLNPAQATTLSFSGNLAPSSFAPLSEGTFTGIAELPEFKMDDLFTPNGVAFTSGSMEFFDSFGKLIPSEVEQGFIRAIGDLPPVAGTLFELEITAMGSLNVNIPNQESCIAAGGIWIPVPQPGHCIGRFIHKDRVQTQAGRISGSLPWLSGEIAVESADQTQIVTQVTSASFTAQSTPEPASILSLLALGTLGATSTLKRKFNQSNTSEKDKIKVD